MIFKVFSNQKDSITVILNKLAFILLLPSQPHWVWKVLRRSTKAPTQPGQQAGASLEHLDTALQGHQVHHSPARSGRGPLHPSLYERGSGVSDSAQYQSRDGLSCARGRSVPASAHSAQGCLLRGQSVPCERVCGPHRLLACAGVMKPQFQLGNGGKAETAWLCHLQIKK